METAKTDQVNGSAPTQQEEYTPIFIKYFEGYSCREIAACFNIPIGSVRERLYKSKRRLRVNYQLFKRSFFASVKK